MLVHDVELGKAQYVCTVSVATAGGAETARDPRARAARAAACVLDTGLLVGRGEADSATSSLSLTGVEAADRAIARVTTLGDDRMADSGVFGDAVESLDFGVEATRVLCDPTSAKETCFFAEAGEASLADAARMSGFF